MEAYLDNSATTRPLDVVCDRMDALARTCYGNPSSLHGMGMRAESVLRQTRDSLLAALHAEDGRVVFTSGGTEANNLAILGTALSAAKRRPRVITTKVEHPSVLEPMRYLEKQGAEVIYLDVDARGCVLLSQLEEALTPQTLLVSIMQVNNEVGTIQPISEAVRLIRRVAPGCVFHVDGVQGFGKVAPAPADVDLYSVSAHKIHGPKGVGALYIRKGRHVRPVMLGGGQEGGLRSGTENVVAIGGFGTAIAHAMADFGAHMAAMSALRDELADGLARIPGCTLNSGTDELAAPHIVNASFAGVKSEVLLHALEAREVYVSTGSACSSNHPALSPVLTAMGLGRAQIDSAVRFSLGRETDAAQVAYAVACVAEEVEKLRAFVR